MKTCTYEKQRLAVRTLGLAAAGFCVTTAVSAQAGSFAEALTGGTPSLDISLRYEHVEQDNALDDAEALTLRPRLGYTTGVFHGLDATLVHESTVDLSDDAYNSSQNGETGRSLVADPEGSEIDEVYLRYTTASGSAFKLGRQKLVLDNSRFVGNVGWRQNEQTFDAFSATLRPLSNVTVNAAYLTRVNNIFYQEVDLDAPLVNVKWELSAALTVSAYGYFLDFEEATRTDSQTLGLRAAGSLPTPIALSYTLEYAQQSDYQDSTSVVDADYWLAELGANFGPVSALLGYEVLGGDGSYAFQTPLATLHAFQGWADQFLNTPVNGIQDAYLNLSAMAPGGVKLAAVYHDFSSDEGSIDYGTELDLLATRKLFQSVALTLKYADYSADDFGVDTQKFWLMLGYKF